MKFKQCYFSCIFLVLFCKCNIESDCKKNVITLGNQLEMIKEINNTKLYSLRPYHSNITERLQENHDTIYQLTNQSLNQYFDKVYNKSETWKNNADIVKLFHLVENLTNKFFFPNIDCRKSIWQNENQLVEKIEAKLDSLTTEAMSISKYSNCKESELRLRINIELELLLHYLTEILSKEYEYNRINAATHSLPYVIKEEKDKDGNLILEITQVLLGSDYLKSIIKVDDKQVDRDGWTYKTKISKNKIRDSIKVISRSTIPKTGVILHGTTYYKPKN